MLRRIAFASLMATMLMAVASACSSDDSGEQGATDRCQSADIATCTGPNGCAGERACVGGSFAECLCGGTGSDGGSDAGADAAADATPNDAMTMEAGVDAAADPCPSGRVVDCTNVCEQNAEGLCSDNISGLEICGLYVGLANIVSPFVVRLPAAEPDPKCGEVCDGLVLRHTITWDAGPTRRARVAAPWKLSTAHAFECPQKFESGCIEVQAGDELRLYIEAGEPLPEERNVFVEDVAVAGGCE